MKSLGSLPVVEDQFEDMPKELLNTLGEITMKMSMSQRNVVQKQGRVFL